MAACGAHLGGALHVVAGAWTAHQHRARRQADIGSARCLSCGGDCGWRPRALASGPRRPRNLGNIEAGPRCERSRPRGRASSFSGVSIAGHWQAREATSPLLVVTRRLLGLYRVEGIWSLQGDVPGRLVVGSPIEHQGIEI
jgi:hypothetical protein